jgi:TPR repeat protein
MAAESGHVRSMFYLATCYDWGKGISKNPIEAFLWYLRAAEGGHRDAQFNIGFFYSTGEFVKQDHQKKVLWYRKAAAQGLIDAQRDIGYCYYNGEGVDVLSGTIRSTWCKKAAGDRHVRQAPKGLYKAVRSYSRCPHSLSFKRYRNKHRMGCYASLVSHNHILS